VPVTVRQTAHAGRTTGAHRAGGPLRCLGARLQPRAAAPQPRRPDALAALVGGLAYTAVELTELVGDDAELAFAPHDQRAVEVYWRGAWLCTAHPHDGDFTTDGRPYRNVYVFRIDWRGDRIAHVEEYGNPVTFSATFSRPA
jgi:hypothetical protein